MKNNFVSESQQLFNTVFTQRLQKLRTTPNTIFENLDYISESDLYTQFIDSNYYDKVITENSTYTKRQIILDFLNESFSDIFYEVKNRIIGSEHGASFNQDYLLENTLTVFPELVKSSITPDLFEEMVHTPYTDEKVKQFEESFLYGGLAAGGALAMGGTPLVAAGAALGTQLAIELFLPTRWSMKVDAKVLGFTAWLSRVLLGTGSILGKNLGSLKNSQASIENFDNIDINPEMVKIFNRIGQRHVFNNGQGAESINVIVEKCITSNKDLFDTGNFNVDVRRGNIYRNIVNSMLINNGNKTSSNAIKYDKLLRFRKCVATSLSDVYKFTMITNLKDVRNYDQILKAANSGFNSDPTQLLNFIDIRNDQAKEIKENLYDLIKLRMLINDMIATFKMGSFGVDKETGTFMEQRFKLVDNEIASYLRSNKQAVDVFERKEYNGIPPKSAGPFNKTYKPIIRTGNNNVVTTSDAPMEEQLEQTEEKPSRLNF